jgi:predicted enzyme related to lactoylglutathione lyase
MSCAKMRLMPHRSRLSILLLDLPAEQHAAGRDFWSAATGRPAEPDPSDENWASLGSFADGWHVEIQRTGTGTPPRWHVDIESDDIDAEVARLESLGARRLADMGGFWQMTDPSGLVFCVVGIQTGEEFDRHAVTWP